MKGLLLISPVINILFYGFAYMWIRGMEKNHCSCSQDWRREYMKYFFLAAIGIQFIIITGGFNSLHNFRVPMSIAAFTYLYASLSYIIELREHSCECSKSLERSILFWYSIIQVLTIILLTWTIAKA